MRTAQIFQQEYRLFPMAVRICMLMGMPVMFMVMMFVSKFGGNTDVASKMVALAHLLSIVTIPLMLTLCKAIGG